jgi:5'-nucleotidase
MQRVSLIVLFFTFSSLCQARLLQIIHTNDLHSQFDGYYNGLGGYARVMTKIKEIRADAKKKGIEVLQLDAGDWGEGSSFFLSDNGADSIKALEMLGTEITTIGNHDHMLGGKILGKQIRAANVKTKFVLANLVQTPDMELGNTLQPYVDLNRGGIPIRVIGLTTSSDYFQYSISPGKIKYPIYIGEAEAKKGKEARRELVIALTHLGLYQDEVLASNSSSIDVIIGGHSHSKLSKVDWIKNQKGKYVPIVQAWAHGLAVGSLLIDVKENGEGVEVVEYKLHEVGAPLAADPEMVEFVEKSARKRNRNFSIDWNEIIGETETPITGYIKGHPVFRSSCWGYHMARAVRKAVNASVGMHVAAFEGTYKPAGPITFGDIVENFPHIRKYGDQGWEIATVTMPGFKLRPLMYWISRRGYGVTFSGLGYKSLPNKKKVMVIDNEVIEDRGIYTVAFPAEMALAINTSLPKYQKYLKGLKYTKKYYWASVVNYIKENSPIRCH